VRSANAPIFGVNTNGELTEWNDKAAALLGYSRDEALGKPFVDTFLREDVRAEVRSVIENACQGVETSHFECPLIDRQGSEVLVLLNAATRMDAGGRIIGMVGVGQDITNLRKVMTEISIQADDLRRIIEHANAPILGIDTEGRVTEWNQKVAEISHYTKDEMLGQVLVETFIHEEYREEVGTILGMALEGDETDNYEFPLFTKSGGRHEILFNATTRRGADGNITGVIGVGQDITKIKQITMEQERIADDLSRLIETANAPIFGVDTDGLITEWNRKAVEISGFTKQETYGQSLVNRFIHQVHRKSVQAVLDQALSSQEVEHIELMLYTRGGEQRDILLNATPRKGADGHVTGVVCVGQDITELNKHRKEAERIAEDLSQLIDTANAPIFGVDKDMHINEWNRWVAKNSGFMKQDVLGKKLTSYINKDCRSMVLRVFAEACKGNLSSNFEVELSTHSNQKPVCLLLNATPRVSPQGDIVGVICVGQDITNIKEIEQKKSSFMAMVSHELKSPLHGIIGLSSSMSDTPGIDTAVQKPLQLIHSCATRLLDMVSNIMDASVLVQDKKMRFSRDTVQMASVVEEVLVLCQHSIDKRGNPVVKTGVCLINAVTALPEIEADAHRCTQVIYNLVTNALKFTHAGHVRVTGATDNVKQTITLTVEDTGIGISQENLERIFQPFDQEDQSETRRYDGLGLGLAICREVVHKHGGSLTVESEKDKGSKFHVNLPFKMSQAAFEGNDNDDKKVEAAFEIDEPEKRKPPEDPLKRVASSFQVQQAGGKIATPHTPAATEAQVSRPAPVPAAPKVAGAGTRGGVMPTTAHNAGTESSPRSSMAAQPSQSLLPAMQAKRETFASTTKIRILSVDDDEVNHEVMVATLGKCDYEVVVVMSGTACLKYIEECQCLPDIILLDVMMPGISGLDVLAELRKTFTVVQLPIIMVSAKNSTSAVVKGLELRCNDWVHKPFDHLELIARVKAQLLIRDMFRDNCGSEIVKQPQQQDGARNTDGARDAARNAADQQLKDLQREALQRELADRKKDLEEVRKAKSEVEERFEDLEKEHKRIVNQHQEQERKVEEKQAEERKQDDRPRRPELVSKETQVFFVELPPANMPPPPPVPRVKASDPSTQAPQPPPVAALPTVNTAPAAGIKPVLPMPVAPKPKSVKSVMTQTNPVRQETHSAIPLPAGVGMSKLMEGEGMLTHLRCENAHLSIEVRSRERLMREAQAQMQQYAMRAELLEQRCLQLEEKIRRHEVNAVYFGTPWLGGAAS